MNSKIFNWSWYDLLKGAVVAASTAGLAGLSQQLDIGHIPTAAEGKVMIISAAAAFVSYMLKNFFSNSDGKIAKGEQK